MDKQELIEELRSLEDLYYNHLEGCDYAEFLKWSDLLSAAALLREAIEEDISYR